VICFDAFGPLELRPHPGTGYFPKGHPQRLPATYRRLFGVRHFLGAYDVHGDWLWGRTYRRKRHQEVLHCLKRLRRRYSPSLRLHIVLDNASAHKHRKVLSWAAANNVRLAFTPTNASWLNRIECHFTALKKFALDGASFPDHASQCQSIQLYCRECNRIAHSRSIH
jgi:transposase